MSATDRLSMLDEYGGRKAIIPAEVRGRFRRWRDRVYNVLLVFFLVLPWLKIGGLQAVLLDIPGRRFEIFGFLFLAHDAPLIFLLLGIFAMGLAFTTAMWGRVWCGWACPQTVFIDGVYRRIERWVEGGYIERRRLQTGPWNARRVGLFVTKWFLYFTVSSLFAHSFIAYFAGSERLIAMVQGGPGENWTYFVWVSAVTALLMFNFGWFREQFCIIMCPYGRFQSVLMDGRTKTVHYDVARGEPRKGVSADQRGDCVSCNRCVQVCPTGIDIRDGVQMECIACTACIDACDEIMTKVNKPLGLIAYASPEKATTLRERPRALAYAGLAAVFAALLMFNLLTRQPFSAGVLRAKDTPYQVLPGGVVMNHFKAHLLNQSHRGQRFRLQLPAEVQNAGVQLKQAAVVTDVAAGQAAEVHFFLLIPEAFFGTRGEAEFKVEIQEGETILTYPVTAVGPFARTAGP